jgi:hypothetical protein
MPGEVALLSGVTGSVGEQAVPVARATARTTRDCFIMVADRFLCLKLRGVFFTTEHTERTENGGDCAVARRPAGRGNDHGL